MWNLSVQKKKKCPKWLPHHCIAYDVCMKLAASSNRRRWNDSCVKIRSQLSHHITDKYNTQTHRIEFETIFHLFFISSILQFLPLSFDLFPTVVGWSAFASIDMKRNPIITSAVPNHHSGVVRSPKTIPPIAAYAQSKSKNSSRIKCMKMPRFHSTYRTTVIGCGTSDGSHHRASLLMQCFHEKYPN